MGRNAQASIIEVALLINCNRSVDRMSNDFKHKGTKARRHKEIIYVAMFFFVSSCLCAFVLKYKTLRLNGYDKFKE